MNILEVKPISRRWPPLISAGLFLIIAIFGFFFIGPVIGGMFILPFYDGDLTTFAQKMSSPFGDDSLKNLIFTVQGVATATGLILIPWIYLKVYENRSLRLFFPTRVALSPVLLTGLIVLAFIAVNSLFIEWNAGLELPEAMSGFENWMRDKEDYAARITEYLTVFDSTSQFAIAFLVIAVLPAIGEELVFRGYIQHELQAASGNPHLAIWAAAILFSAIHMQFYGFVPRLLLGALFGYLYLWSGNLIYPIIAHFVQNGSQLFILYMAQNHIIDLNVEDPESFPVLVILLFAGITFSLMVIFRKFFLKLKT